MFIFKTYLSARHSAEVSAGSESFQEPSPASAIEQPSLDAHSQIEPELASSTPPIDAEAQTSPEQESSQMASTSQTTEVFEEPGSVGAVAVLGA